MAESHSLNPRPYDEGPSPKVAKLRLNLHGIILKAKSIGSNPKLKLKIIFFIKNKNKNILNLKIHLNLLKFKNIFIKKRKKKERAHDLENQDAS